MGKANLFLFTLITLSIACGGGERASQANASVSRDTVDRSEKAVVSQRPGGGGGGGTESTSPALASLAQATSLPIDTAPTDRKIIRNADLSLETDTPEDAQKKITGIAESNGGFVVESQQTSSDTKVTTHDVVTMTLRVPAQKFTEALDEIRKTGSRVLIETVKGDDVTEEFIDVEARLKAQQALEQQFIEIMKRANSVDDALNVQRQLAEVRGDIEKIAGRKRFLENQASLSTIKVKLQTPTAFSASSTGFMYRLTQSFGSGIDFAMNFVLGLVTFIIAILPFALFIVLPIFLLIRFVIRRYSRPASLGEIVKEETKST